MRSGHALDFTGRLPPSGVTHRIRVELRGDNRLYFDKDGECMFSLGPDAYALMQHYVKFMRGTDQ